MHSLCDVSIKQSGQKELRFLYLDYLMQHFVASPAPPQHNFSQHWEKLLLI